MFMFTLQALTSLLNNTIIIFLIAPVIPVSSGLPLCGGVPRGGDHRVDSEIHRDDVCDGERVAQHDSKKTFANLETSQKAL